MIINGLTFFLVPSFHLLFPVVQFYKLYICEWIQTIFIWILSSQYYIKLQHKKLCYWKISIFVAFFFMWYAFAYKRCKLYEYFQISIEINILLYSQKNVFGKLQRILFCHKYIVVCFMVLFSVYPYKISYKIQKWISFNLWYADIVCRYPFQI